ncbi:alkyl sulfatase C-terminal domain-containing protein [Pararhizobium sp. PWRC1-1]
MIRKGALEGGLIKTEGQAEAIGELLGLMTKFEYWFPIVTPPVIV